MMSLRRGHAVLWLLLLALLQGCRGEPRLAKRGSTHPSFPLDAFAKPAYRIVFQDDRPVSNQTAIEIIRASRKQGKSAVDDHSIQSIKSDSFATDSNASGKLNKFRAYLHRSAPNALHVCTLEHSDRSESHTPLRLDEQAMDEYRSGVLHRAMELLAPLKNGCLFHTHDWFTYSFCHGDALRQFRALPNTLGGGKTPAMDPSQDSYVLGRWKPEAEIIQSSSPDERTTRYVGDSSATEEPQTIVSSEAGDKIDDDERQLGTQLMELVHFSSIETGADSERDSMAGYTSVEGKGRYISQYWSDGTLCNINNEPRSTEVQFHCAKSPPVDRIALIKEVTTCSYVLVIETPRLCDEPALAQVEDEIEEVHCRPILSDKALHERYLQDVKKTHASLLEGEQQASESAGLTEADAGATPEPGGSGSASAANSLESQIHSVFEKLTRSKLAAGKSILDEVEVVVGMDEEGNFILEPRTDPPTDDPLSGSHEDVFYDTSEASSTSEQQDTSESQAGHGISAEKLAEVVERIKELGLLSADGSLIKIIQGAEPASAGNADGGDTATSQSQQHAEQASSGTDAQQKPVAGQGQAQRGNIMVRETETFAQRVDRIFRAQEELAAKRQSDRQARAPASNDRSDEHEKKRANHVEL